MRRYVVSLVVVAVLSFASLFLFAGAGIGASETVTSIRLRDACDPATFNAVIGPGTCEAGQHGTQTFQLFIQEVSEDRVAGSWRYSFPKFVVATGRPTQLDNRGGEFHTFTRVAKFGGGFVDVLNQLSGNPVPAPECLAPPSGSNVFVPGNTAIPGPVAGSPDLPAGVNRFECCIHPWMRTTITVK
jgi:hypothetical protein